MRKVIGRVVVAMLAGVALMGQATKPEAGATSQPAPLRIQLMDGSMLVGKISVPELTMETAYGTLKVPVESEVLSRPSSHAA